MHKPNPLTAQERKILALKAHAQRLTRRVRMLEYLLRVAEAGKKKVGAGIKWTVKAPRQEPVRWRVDPPPVVAAPALGQVQARFNPGQEPGAR